MILDGYWKKELQRNIKSIKLWLKLSKVFTQYAEHQINQNILYSAIVMRKMFEDEKHYEKLCMKHRHPLPPFKLLKYEVEVKNCPFCGDKDFIIEQLIPENYDFKQSKTEKIELNFLCNQIIHSFVWSVVYYQNTRKIYGFAVASDRESNKNIYLFEIKEFIKAVEFCVENGNI